MGTGLGLAEVRLLNQQISLFGTVTQLTDHSISVRLHTVPVAAGALQTGSIAQVLCWRHSALFTSRASIAGSCGPDLVLNFDRTVGSASPVDRRLHPRVKCRIEAQYRAVRPDGRASAWRYGNIIDVSVSGIGMLLDNCNEVPGKMEVRFNLAAGDYADGGCAPDLRDLGRGALNDSHVSRAIARTIRCMVDPSGALRTGLLFLSLGPTDRDRIERFVNGGIGDEGCAQQATVV